MRLGIVGVKRQSLPVMRNRRVPLALLRQHAGEVGASGSGTRTERDRALVAGDRVRRPALLAADIAEVEVGEGMVASQLDRSLEMRRHLIHAVESSPRPGDGEVIFGNP